MFLVLLALAKSQNTWEDPETGATYDWSVLSNKKSNYYQFEELSKAEPSLYLFNFGKDLPISCAGQYPSAMEKVKLIDGSVESCSILGRSDMQSVETFSKGIIVTYGGGDICYDANLYTSRQISFRLSCSMVEGQWNVIQSYSENGCTVILEMKTNAGCPKPIGFDYIAGIIVAFEIITLYLAIGGTILYLQGYTFKDVYHSSLEAAREKIQSFFGNNKKVKCSAIDIKQAYQKV